MKVTIVNKNICIGNMEVAGIGSSSVVLIGDTESIVNSTYFDTPADSLIFDPRVPLKSISRTDLVPNNDDIEVKTRG